MASRSTAPATRADRRTLVGVWSQRSVIDYGLARRATLTSLLGGGCGHAEDACDAHPYLLLAARHHGEPTGRECPVCRARAAGRGELRLRRRAGPVLGPGQGSRRAARWPTSTASSRVYVVEVCRGCGWNHLVRSYVLGDGVDRRVARGSRRTAYAGSSYGVEG